MPSNTRNIVIFLILLAMIASVYIFFIRAPQVEEGNLVTNSGAVSSDGIVANTSNQTEIAQNFLTLLLSIKNIRLDDSIFNDPAFQKLRDSSIVLSPDSTTGRPNPFAQFGSDNIPVVPNPGTVTPATPAAGSTSTQSSTSTTTPAGPATPTTPTTPTTPSTGAGSKTP